MLIPGASTPKLIRREHLRQMKPGSVIVDVAVDQGGCVETSHVTYHDDPVYTVEGVLHYGVANIPARFPGHRQWPDQRNNRLWLKIADLGLEKAAAADPGLKKGINIYRAAAARVKNVARSFGIAYTPFEAS